MAYTSHRTLLSLHTRHAERAFDKSHGLDESRREKLFKRVLKDRSHRVTHRLHRLENRSTPPVIDYIADRDVNADIHLRELVTQGSEIRMRGMLLNYPTEALIGSIVNTLPIKSAFKRGSFTFVETGTDKRQRWYRVHGELSLLDPVVDIPVV